MSLKNGDLRGVITPYVSIDEFEPKSGTNQEVIVVGFYAEEQDPANDLNTFIQRGSFDVLDADVSPSPDEEGRYLVFVEFDRSDLFPETFEKFLKDVENLTTAHEWQIKPYLADNAMKLSDDIYKYIILDPEGYKTKDEFSLDDEEGDLEESFSDSQLNSFVINENYAVFDDRIAAKILDYGSHDEITKTIYESVITFDDKTEIHALSKMLGKNWNVFNMTDKVAVEHATGDFVLVLEDIQFVY